MGLFPLTPEQKSEVEMFLSNENCFGEVPLWEIVIRTILEVGFEIGKYSIKNYPRKEDTWVFALRWKAQEYLGVSLTDCSYQLHSYSNPNRD